MKTKNLLLVFALSVATTAYAPPRTPGDPSPLVTRSANELIAVLKSDAGLKDKMDACRELSVVGNRQAVPALVPLLTDEKINHMARYALETIPDAGVNSALRSELPKLKGRPLAGVIASLGVRKDVSAVKSLKPYLADTDPDVAQAAARSLSRIGTSDAAKAIQAALASAAPTNQLALYESWLRCADEFAARRQATAAMEIYDSIRLTAGLPAQVRMGAIRGAILARGEAGQRLLTECLWTGDYTVFAAGVQTAMEMQGTETTKILAACAHGIRADHQILILQALGRRGAEAVSALAEFAEDTTAQPVRRRARQRNAQDAQDPAAVRLAAIRALAETDQPTALPVLLRLLGDADQEIAQAAQDGIAALTGKAADNAVLALAKSSKKAERLMGLELLGKRRMTGSIATLLTGASDADADIRHASLKRWGELASSSDVMDLLEILRPMTDAADLNAAEEAFTELCSRSDDSDAICEQLVGALQEAQPVQKASILNVLGSAGSAVALPALRAALDEGAEVRAAAVKALTDWPDAVVMPDLLSLAKSGSEAEKPQALRGYIRLVGESNAAANEKAKQLREAAALATTAADKKQLLAGLGEIVAVDAMKLAGSYLSDPALADEAGAAVVKIAAKLTEQDKAAIGEELSQVLKSAKSESVLGKARKRLRELGVSSS